LRGFGIFGVETTPISPLEFLGKPDVSRFVPKGLTEHCSGEIRNILAGRFETGEETSVLV
jgi:hypothetical protein